MCLKRHSSIAAKEPEAIAEARLLGHEDAHGLGQRLDLEDAGHDRLTLEVAWKNHSVAVTDLSPTIRLASASYSTIRSTSRNGQRCGISCSICRVVRMGALLAALSGM